MIWEFETAEGHTIRLTLAPDGVAISTRRVHGPVDGEVFDLDTFESSVLPAMEAYAGPDEIEAIREALERARAERDWDDDEIP